MIIRRLNKVVKLVLYMIAFKVSWLLTCFKFKMNGVEFHSDFMAGGVPIINVNLKGKCSIGRKLEILSGRYFNMIGRQQRCYLLVGKDAQLIIGNNVGISCTAIICHNRVIIGNNVRIGGGVVIYDSDFHSLNASERTAVPEIKENIKTAPVIVKDFAFIGAHSIILKGVTVGANSIIGAGSVLTKSVPDNEIWGGNPAVFIRKL